MKRIIPVLAALLASVTSFRALADSPAFDVVGIRLGMSVTDAMRALKADNPRLQLTPSTRQLEGFSSPLMLSVIGDEAATPGPGGTTARGGETVEILFTLPPSMEAVWGVQRKYHFATSERPSMEATLGALMKKYGPAAVPPSPDARDHTKSIIWVYDAQGRALGPAGRQLIVPCANLMSHFGNGDTGTANELETGQFGPAECQSIMVISASIQGSAVTAGSAELAVNDLIVQMIDNARHSVSTKATRAVAVNAANARDKQSTEDLQKRGAPKL
jgi:hypothetical protein